MTSISAPDAFSSSTPTVISIVGQKRAGEFLEITHFKRKKRPSYKHEMYKKIFNDAYHLMTNEILYMFPCAQYRFKEKKIRFKLSRDPLFQNEIFYRYYDYETTLNISKGYLKIYKTGVISILAQVILGIIYSNNLRLLSSILTYTDPYQYAREKIKFDQDCDEQLLRVLYQFKDRYPFLENDIILIFKTAHQGSTMNAQNISWIAGIVLEDFLTNKIGLDPEITEEVKKYLTIGVDPSQVSTPGFEDVSATETNPAPTSFNELLNTNTICQ